MKWRDKKTPSLFMFGGAILLSATFVGTYCAFSDLFSTPGYVNNGTIAIMSYFDSGSGTSTDPFVITRPRHLYNLSKLQTLGAFTNTDTYFQVGKILDGTVTNKVYKTDATDAAVGTELDMSDYGLSSSYQFVTIGDHACPFTSTIDGSNIVVSNLSVSSDPDDSGVFGYVGENGSVSNFYFKNVTVNVNGHKNSLESIFDDTVVYNDSMTYDSTTITTTEYLKAIDGITRGDGGNISTKFTDVFQVTLPTNAIDGVTYSTTLSNELLSYTTSPDGTNCFLINYEVAGTQTFFETDKNYMVGRVYVQANKTVDNIDYSRVISSYQVILANTLDTTEGNTMTVHVTKDDYDSEDTTTITQYHHNNNIGLIAAHVDGSISDCYVYVGTMQANTADASYTAANFESDWVTIGEAGESVDNQLDPNREAVGDVGYLCADEVYNKAVSATPNYTSQSSGYSFVPQYYTTSQTNLRPLYNALTKNTSAVVSSADGNTDGYTDYYYGVTSSSGEISFKKNSIVHGNSANGLGVFDIVTDNSESSISDPTSYDGSASTIKNLNSGSTTVDTSRILYSTNEIYDENQQTEVNYAYDMHTVTGGLRGSFAEPWSRTLAGSQTLSPASYNENSVSSQCYFYEATLNTDTGKTVRYFKNTPYEYLASCLENTLVDATGAHIDRDNSQFGITIRSVDDDGNQADVSSFTHYVTTIGRSRIEFVKDKDDSVAAGGTFTKVAFNKSLGQVVEGNAGSSSTVYTGEYYPFGEYNFELNRDANVTIVYPGLAAAGSNATSPYITIMRRDVAIQNSYNGTRYPTAATFYPTNTDVNSKNIYYYPETLDSGKTASTQTPKRWTSNSRPLLAHTFFLKKGKYFMSNNCFSSEIPFCYIAVEGQDSGRLSGIKKYTTTNHIIENIDFLLNDPLGAEFVLASSRANTSVDLRMLSTGASNVVVNTGTQNGTLYLNIQSTDTGIVPYIIAYNYGDTPIYIKINNLSLSNDSVVTWTYS